MLCVMASILSPPPPPVYVLLPPVEVWEDLSKIGKLPSGPNMPPKGKLFYKIET